MTLSNSFGFGGSNSCVVLRHPEMSSSRRADGQGRESLITGSGAVCASGMSPADILAARARRALGDRADPAMGHHRMAGDGGRRK